MIPILPCYTAMQGMMKKLARICSTKSPDRIFGPNLSLRHRRPTKLDLFVLQTALQVYELFVFGRAIVSGTILKLNSFRRISVV